ncbi:MAG: malto-oligosyltrehalose trehalohydrolase [Acidobacteriota bacterium]
MARPERAHPWQPTIGAWPVDRGFRFRVWAPTRRQVTLVLDPTGPHRREIPLESQGDGTFAVTVAEATAGDRYAYRLDNEGPLPDPASRAQPDGVHAPSALVDPWRFSWSDHGWGGISLDRAVIYELHVGTFTAAGTFAAAADRLAYVADLGVTVVELMPVADFPGRWSWGYDGVSLFAPARCYGTPDQLRAFVDSAHRVGLAVLIDVVYNHFGPDGAYLATFSPYYLSATHQSPWGAAVNLDGEHADHVRAFFIENALHWLHEYHADGLRLDATHAMVDESPCHFGRDLAIHVRASAADRTTLLIAEDERNVAVIVRPLAHDGWGFDAVWADDFHHQLRRLSAGDSDGYFQDYSGSTSDIAQTIRRGWFFRGEMSPYLGKPRGTDPAGIPVRRMVACIQNHDQIGNRAFGERLNHQIEPALYRALSALLLFAPETPLMFMGQEWAASSRFLYFTDHHEQLGQLVNEGRRREFSRFAAFADASTRAQIPDPQAPSTIDASRLHWEEQSLPAHAGTLALYRDLLRLRGQESALRWLDFEVEAPDEDALVLARRGVDSETLVMVLKVRGQGAVEISKEPWSRADAGWVLVLTTDDAPYIGGSNGEETERPMFDPSAEVPSVIFRRPGAVILRVVSDGSRAA